MSVFLDWADHTHEGTRLHVGCPRCARSVEALETAAWRQHVEGLVERFDVPCPACDGDAGMECPDCDGGLPSCGTCLGTGKLVCRVCGSSGTDWVATIDGIVRFAESAREGVP